MTLSSEIASPTILIADSSKASLVMSSEVFKDRIPGARVLVATSGKDCLDMAAAEKPDMIVVDFDLPDADGASLVAMLRRKYAGPIIMTAYPSDEVDKLVNQDLFVYNDCGSVISKPVSQEVLNARIDQFLMNRFRVDRRFDVSFPIEIRKKLVGRGSRSPKFSAEIVNISLGGLSCNLDMPVKFSDKDDIHLMLPLLYKQKKKPIAVAKGKAKVSAAPKVPLPAAGDCFSLRGRVAWQSKKLLGIRFDLSDKNKSDLETLLRSLVIVG